MPVDSLQHIDQVRVGVHALQLAGHEQALDRADAPRAQFRPGEQLVAPADRDRPKAAFQMIGVDGDLGVLKEYPQPRLALCRVGQRLPERAARQQVQPLALLLAPVEERRHRLLSCRLFGQQVPVFSYILS